MALAAHLAGCARPAADGRPVAAPDPSDLFRDVCGRLDDGSRHLARALEASGFRRARETTVPRSLAGRSTRVYADGANGESVLVALDHAGGACTVAARRADLAAALRRFSGDVLGQAGPHRTVARADEGEFADGRGPMRAGFRVTPSRAGAPVAYAFLYTFSGDASPTADAQLVMQARLVPSPP